MKRDYDSLISSGVKAQIEKLNMNEHKKGFDNIDIEYALNRIADEYDELLREVFLIDTYDGCTNYYFNEGKDYSKVRKEAADIANFAHMIIYKCDQELDNTP